MTKSQMQNEQRCAVPCGACARTVSMTLCGKAVLSSPKTV